MIRHHREFAQEAAEFAKATLLGGLRPVDTRAA
jgi:hypothetical protein